MNTTAAALEAHVTVATIRTWCRIGAVVAAKVAGRWVITATSLARRIAIGAMRAAARTEATVTEPTHWDPDHPNIELLNQATAAGVPADLIANRVGRGTLSSGQRLSNRDKEAILRYIESYTERTKLLDELQHLSTCFGNDGAAKRAAADAQLTTTQLRQMVADCYTYARQMNIDVRTAAQKAPRLATPRQVDYIISLLVQRARSGEGGGFMDGPTDRARIERMTAADASSYIDSLKGTY